MSDGVGKSTNKFRDTTVYRVYGSLVAGVNQLSEIASVQRTIATVEARNLAGTLATAAIQSGVWFDVSIKER